ncbi:unnamed protein product, partial [Mesorhabditis belari]|uniref:Cytochrome P450 n=1 Tax=Mesorhabditis belari TaxID=2138241 RepID=A0AAF3F3G0_9BILA
MLLFLFLILISLFLFYEFYWKRRNYPPGPLPLPLFGNLLQILLNFPGYELFMKWRQQYGPVFTFWFSFSPIVVVADYETMRESLVKDGDKYADRYTLEEFNALVRGGQYGIIQANGDLWREQRRFTLHTLRDFGMGRNLMEERVMLEVDFLAERLIQQGSNIFVQKEFDTAVGSIINNILFGYRFDEEHMHEFDLVKGALRKMMQSGSNPLFLVAASVPFTRDLPLFKGAFQQVMNDNKTFYGFIAKQINARRADVDLESEISNDFVECYLKEQHKKKGSDQEDFYSDIQLQNLVLDMWMAGLETTSNTLTWALCYILNHPEVQEKLHEELDRVIKSDRKITMSDKNSLPYVNAVINETQRLGNLLPQNTPRKTSEEVILGGYRIPKGTPIMAQIATLFCDEKIFPEPYRFNPDRFINLDGSLKSYPEFIPFSLGKRQCVGEGLAKVELFLFLANLYQQFIITSDIRPSIEKKPAQIITAQPFYCNVARRFS